MISELLAWIISGAIVNGPANAKERKDKRINAQNKRVLLNMARIDNEVLLRYNISYRVYSIEYEKECDYAKIVLHVFGSANNPNEKLAFKCTLYNKSGIPFAKDYDSIILDEEFNEMNFSFYDIKDTIDTVRIEALE